MPLRPNIHHPDPFKQRVRPLVPILHRIIFVGIRGRLITVQ